MWRRRVIVDKKMECFEKKGMMSKELSLTIKNWKLFLFIYFLLVLPLCLAVGSYSEPGIELVPSAVEAWSDNHWATKEVPKTILIHNITETGVQIGDFQTEVFISIMINRDLNSSGSPMNCAYFIDRIEWSCQITKSSKNSPNKLPHSESPPCSNKSDNYLFKATSKKWTVSIWNTKWFQ